MLNPVSSSIAVATGVRRDVTASPSRNAVAAILSPDDILLDLDVRTRSSARSRTSPASSRARHGLVGRGRAMQVSSSAKRSGPPRLARDSPSRMRGCRDCLARSRHSSARKFRFRSTRRTASRSSDLLVLLVPQHATEAHLLLLAEAAAMFCDVSFRERSACLRRCRRGSLRPSRSGGLRERLSDRGQPWKQRRNGCARSKSSSMSTFPVAGRRSVRSV